MRAYPKPAKPWRNKAYLRRVASDACLGCEKGKTFDDIPFNVAHHCRDLVECGGSEKPGDQWTIPVCYLCHKKADAHPDFISKRVKLNYISNSLNAYLTEKIPRG